MKILLKSKRKVSKRRNTRKTQYGGNPPEISDQEYKFNRNQETLKYTKECFHKLLPKDVIEQNLLAARMQQNSSSKSIPGTQSLTEEQFNSLTKADQAKYYPVETFYGFGQTDRKYVLKSEIPAQNTILKKDIEIFTYANLTKDKKDLYEPVYNPIYTETIEGYTLKPTIPASQKTIEKTAYDKLSKEEQKKV